MAKIKPHIFNFERLPKPADFCGRKQETALMKQLIGDSKNIVLFGDRRYGKTSLIEHVYRELPDNTLCAFADLFACIEAVDVAEAIYQAVADALPFSLEHKLKELAGAFSRINLDVTPDANGSFNLAPRLSSRDFDELIQDALEGAERLCQNLDKTLVIALDEFQQIAEIKDKRIDATLRKYMQRLTRVSFIFSGSKKSILSQLFINKKRPLYGMASSINIGGIEPKTFLSYINKRIDKPCKQDDFMALYTRVRGQTKLILQSFYWINNDKLPANTETLNATLERLIKEKEQEFKLLFDTFTAQQKKILKLISVTKGTDIFAKTTLQHFGLSKQQVNQALNILIKNSYVYKEDAGKYLIADIHFALWCTQKFA